MKYKSLEDSSLRPSLHWGLLCHEAKTVLKQAASQAPIARQAVQIQSREYITRLKRKQCKRLVLPAFPGIWQRGKTRLAKIPQIVRTIAVQRVSCECRLLESAGISEGRESSTLRLIQPTVSVRMYLMFALRGASDYLPHAWPFYGSAER